MKLHQLIEATNREIDLSKDGKLQARLKIIDTNIEMFSSLGGKSAKKVEELKAGRDLLVKYYNGEVDFKAVPYRIWELTSEMPAWGHRGT